MNSGTLEALSFLGLTISAFGTWAITMIGSNLAGSKPRLRIEILIDHQRRRRRRKQRVTIGSRMIDEFGADIARRAGAVLDDDRLAPFARQPVRDQPRNGVGGAAGRERHDDFDRPVRIIFGTRRATTTRTDEARAPMHHRRAGRQASGWVYATHMRFLPAFSTV